VNAEQLQLTAYWDTNTALQPAGGRGGDANALSADRVATNMYIRTVNTVADLEVS
jgi:hypothetical protein